MLTTDSIPHLAYHYCGLQALYGIVSESRFRLSNVFFTNDFLEVEWFKDTICRSVLRQNRDQITRTKTTHYGTSPPGSSLSTASSSATSSVPHSQFYAALDKSLATRSFDHIYCGCFSTEADDLSQWRGYADDASGVAIGFDLLAILDAPTQPATLRHVTVRYDSELAKKEASKIILSRADDVAADHDVGEAHSTASVAYAFLRELAPCFKNPKFAAEREVRLVVADTTVTNRPDKDEDAPTIIGALEFYVRRGTLVPYVTVQVPTNAIGEVWLGPRFGDELNESSLKLFLTAHGVLARIRRSEASYRS